jgi:hypothetical protein
MAKVFDYVNEILQGKKNLMVTEEDEKTYIPFLINRALSYHYDCVLFANEMNRRHFLDKKCQHDFFINTIRSKKRPYVKWGKSEKEDDLEYIKKAYGFSDSKAIEALRLLNKEDIQKLKEQTDIGGLRK